jgi:hypothetical protein
MVRPFNPAFYPCPPDRDEIDENSFCEVNGSSLTEALKEMAEDETGLPSRASSPGFS